MPFCSNWNILELSIIKNMFGHITDAIKKPCIIRIGKNLYGVRFETMKVYSTLTAVEYLLKANIVKKGDTLIDSSSGIYAYALALACHKFSMRCHIIASQTVDKTLLTQLKILGAVVDQVHTSGSFKRDQSLRIEKLKEVLRRDSTIHWMRQYHDDIHYLGYQPVGKQITEALGTEQLTIVGSIGSGCSTGYIGYRLNSAYTAPLIYFASMRFLLGTPVVVITWLLLMKQGTGQTETLFLLWRIQVIDM